MLSTYALLLLLHDNPKLESTPAQFRQAHSIEVIIADASHSKPVWQLCTQLGLKPIYADSSPFIILENNGNLAGLYRLVADGRVKSIYAYPPCFRFAPEPPKPPPPPPSWGPLLRILGLMFS